MAWPVPVLFGLPLMMLCRRRDRGPCWQWLIASSVIWFSIDLGGFVVCLVLPTIGIPIMGILGALAFAGAFSLLIRRIRVADLAWLVWAGLVGGIVFTVVGWIPSPELVMNLHYVPSPVGFAVWQVTVGPVLVWMAAR